MNYLRIGQELCVPAGEIQHPMDDYSQPTGRMWSGGMTVQRRIDRESVRVV